MPEPRGSPRTRSGCIERTPSGVRRCSCGYGVFRLRMDFTLCSPCSAQDDRVGGGEDEGRDHARPSTRITSVERFRPSLRERAMHLTKGGSLTEYSPDSYPSSFLRVVSFSGLRRPAILVHAGVVVDCRVLKCQLAFRASCRTDCAGRCTACHAPRSAAWPRDLAAQLGRVELRQNALDCCPLVDGRFVLWIPGG